MSTKWYECKIKYRKTDETGKQKMVTEPYLVDALSYTEAESRIHEEAKTFVTEEFMITTIKVANFAEIYPFEKTDKWFKTKVSLVAYDEESGKERKTSLYLLVQANDVKEAFDNTVTAMAGTMGDYEIPAISESPIMDVFPYFSGVEEEMEIAESFLQRKNSKTEIYEEKIDTMEFVTLENN